MPDRHAAFIPSGAAIAGTYGQGIAPANTGRGGALALPSAHRAVTGGDYVEPRDSRMCRHDGCRGWATKASADEHLCVGHMNQKKAADGAQPGPDQDVRTNAP